MHRAWVTKHVTYTGQSWPWSFLCLVQHQTFLIPRYFFKSPFAQPSWKFKKKFNLKKKRKRKNQNLELYFLLGIYLTFTFHVPLTISCTSALPDFVLFSKMDFLLSCLKHPNDLCFGFFLHHHMLDNCAQRNYFQSGLNTKEKHTANFFSRAVQTFP